MRTAFISLALIASSATAQAMPPSDVFILGGSVLGAETTSSDGDMTIGPVYGPHVQVGIEIGDRWTSQFSFVFSHARGSAKDRTHPNLDFTTTVTQYAGGYQLAFDVLGKDARLSPYFGAGIYAGTADISVVGSDGVRTAGEDGSVFMLEAHLVGGLRYNIGNGFGLRAEVMYSTYGGFLGTWIPMVGATWQLPGSGQHTGATK